MDEYFLKKTFYLAKKGIGWVNPNPMVGAMIVKDGQIIGKGYHKQIGLPHAEIEALRSCKVSAKGATLYVNLEPCVHFGRTPPCVEAIINSGVKRVVCATLDPNPKVKGQGLSELGEKGILCEVGLLKDQATALNEAFFTFQEKKRPFVAIKFAASLDGKIATYLGDSKWITNQQSRDFARLLRGQYQAVLVGIKTVLSDDPHLGVRVKGAKDPLRIILDSKLRISLKSQVLRDQDVLIMTTKKANPKKLTELQERGFEVIIFDENIKIPQFIKILRQNEIISVLVEGGGQVLGSFADARLIDKVYAFVSPIIIGGEKALGAVGGQGIKKLADAIKLKNISFKKFDDNLLTIGYPIL